MTNPPPVWNVRESLDLIPVLSLVVFQISFDAVRSLWTVWSCAYVGEGRTRTGSHRWSDLHNPLLQSRGRNWRLNKWLIIFSHHECVNISSLLENPAWRDWRWWVFVRVEGRGSVRLSLNVWSCLFQDLPNTLYHLKIFTAGHEVPNDATILSFKKAVRHFLRDNENNGKL